MLIQRILTALVLAPLVVAAVLWLPAPAMAFLAALIFMLGFDEWVMLCGFRGGPCARSLPWAWPRCSPRCICGIRPGWTRSCCAWARCGGCWSCSGCGNISFAAAPTRQNGLIKLAAGLLTIVPAWAALLWLHAHSKYGIWLLIALLMVWGADIGAYFAGTLFGRRKLAPHISPGKTWAGVYGALSVSLLVALVAGLLLQLAWPTLIGLLILTLIAVAASIIGDLLESLAKRHALVKDSGALFPGHGGLMDRMDSVCALLPVFALGVWLLGL